MAQYTKEELAEIKEQIKSAMLQGFEGGFKHAIDVVRIVAEDGKEGPTKIAAGYIVKMLEEALPKVMEDAPDMIQIMEIHEPPADKIVWN